MITDAAETATPTAPAARMIARAKPASAPAAGADDDMPLPLPEGLAPVPAFDYDLLPGALRGWVRDIAHRMQCPPDMIAAPAMVALSGALGRRLAIRPKQRDDWTVIANLWGVVIARPGAMKSPAMAEAMRPLRYLEAQAAAAHVNANEEHRKAAIVAKVDAEAKTQAMRAAHKKDPTGASAFALVPDEPPEAPKPQRFIVSDCTMEALADVLTYNPQGLTVERDELAGLLRTLDRDDSAAARAFYLTAWNGDSAHTIDRIGRGHSVIPAACLSMIGSAQPARWLEYLSTTTGAAAGADGLVQRFQMLVWPDHSPGFKYVDEYRDPEARAAAYAVFERLANIDPDAIGAQRDTFAKAADVPFFRFDNEAQPIFETWLTDLERELRAGELTDELEGHLSKYRKLIPALALLCHLAESEHPAPLVNEEALTRALRWGEYLQTHALRAYGAARNPGVKTAKLIRERIGGERGDAGRLHPDGFTKREIQRKDWRGLTDGDAIEQGLDLLTNYDWLTRRHVEGKNGRETFVYQTAPGFFEALAAEKAQAKKKAGESRA